MQRATAAARMGWQRAPRLSVLRALPSRMPAPATGSSRHLLRTFCAAARQIQITERCVERIQELNAESEQTAVQRFLRLSVEPGGCSGFQYQFALDNEDTIEEDDLIFERSGAKVVVDEGSLALVDGSTIDFEETMMSTSFVVLDNPQSGASCGCGTSFQAKE